MNRTETVISICREVSVAMSSKVLGQSKRNFVVHSDYSGTVAKKSCRITLHNLWGIAGDSTIVNKAWSMLVGDELYRLQSGHSELGIFWFTTKWPLFS